ncbi:hypothetical protein LSAT2_016863 [Lamellibrachia satsuma]|nr:hypothetical protein LSAT2_016863 [Lamellibrachia satsuma]
MPFDNFQMLPLWVRTYSDRFAVEDALRDVGTRIPYAASIDVTNLRGSSLGAFHYTTAQKAELSNRFFGAWNAAKASALAYPPPITNPILIVRQGSSLFTNRCDAVRDEVTDTRGSRLHELWRYRRAYRGYGYHIVVQHI